MSALGRTVLVASLLLYPFVDRALGWQTVHAVSDGMIYVLLALGLNIVVGYAGLLDLGYAAFFAIGAYAMGLLNSPVLGSPLYGHAWSFWLCIWLAAAMSALLGVVIGAPTLRVRGDYLAIITLGFGEIIPVAIRNLGDITVDIGGWRPIERLNLTGGEDGGHPVGRPYLPGVPFETHPMPWYFLLLVIGAGSLWAMNRLRDSRLGRAWMAIREDETAADCTGVNPVSTKLLAFALGASFSGFAGSVYAAKLQAITPGAFEFQVSIMLLCMVVLGGAGSIRGVVLGAMLITVFDRVILSQTTFLVRGLGRTLGVPALVSLDLTLWRWFFFGLGLVLVMLLRPQGLAGRRAHATVARGCPRTFRSSRLFPYMTVLDNVLVGEHCRLEARVAGAVLRPPRVRAEEARARERARSLLTFVGLSGKEDELARNLPYGDQRRLEIARALATEPRLLLLDEPTAGMNPRESHTLTDLIGLLRRELSLSILLIEHDMQVGRRSSDRITVLDYGTRIAEGTPTDLPRHPRVIEAYLGTGYEQEPAARSTPP